MEDQTEDLDSTVFEAYSEMLPLELLSQIYREFLAQTRDRLANLAEDRRPEWVRSTAHTIAGTAGMLGASGIAQRAGLMERGEGICEPPQLKSLLGACTRLESRLRERNVAL